VLRLWQLAAAAGLLALTAGSGLAADEPVASDALTQAQTQDEARTESEIAPEQADVEQRSGAPIDPVTEVVRGDALTQIRIAAISFQNQKNLGQALSGVIGAFLKRDRLKDAMVDLSVIHDPVWRAYALLHFAEYHYARGELDTVKSLLQRVDKLTQDLTARPEEAKVLSFVSQRTAEYGQFAAARRIAGRIDDPLKRVAKFIEFARLQSGDINKKVAAAAVDNLRLAFLHLQKSTLGKEVRLAQFLAVANTAISLRYFKFAREIFESGYAILAKTPYDGNTPIIAEFAAGMVRAGQQQRAMEIIRSMKNDRRHAYALASVARAFATSGSIEGAVPLFFLALQDTESLEEGPDKFKLLTHILKEQTRSGRLADAFNTAGMIKDKDLQREALFAMAEILLANDKPLEALKLVDYLPDMGMRAQILTRAARYHYLGEDRKMAAELMLQSVKPTGTDATIETLSTGIPLIFEAQVEMGKGDEREKVFAGARKLLEQIPNTPVKVPVMTRIALAEMRDGQKDASERSLGMAWRIAWLNKDKPTFPQMLTDIAMAQLNIGELLLAFDTAARISNNPSEDINEVRLMFERQENPKMKALTAIAVAAARKSEGQLALRAARSILSPSGRASAYRQIALAFPATNQEAKLGKGTVPMEPGPVRGDIISPAVEGSPFPAEK